MTAVIILVVAIILFIIAYRTYGTFIARRLDLSNKNITPAHTKNDGVDYVPAKPPVLLGHHFASIAGAGPIVGPIMASVFGWIPVVLWIVIGGIFFGAMHDFTTLVASARHEGKSIGVVIEKYIGRTGKILFMIFTWFTLILVMAVFARLVATTFVVNPAVASASLLFIMVALVFGVAVYRRKLPLAICSIIGVVVIFLCINLGMRFPLTVYPMFLDQPVKTELVTQVDAGEIPAISDITTAKAYFSAQNNETVLTALNQAEKKAFDFWIYVLLIYIFIAATAPVWVLLQPRDYLNSFLLYGLLGLGVVGVFFARPEIHLPTAVATTDQLGAIFPILFITVACGAISGFHSLVSSGTTAKQLDRESDAKPIGYGGMLIESVLAILALLAAASLFQDRFAELYATRKFVPMFSEGIGGFISAIPVLGISKQSAVTFSALAVSAFALTSLDTCTRLARFVFQEFFETPAKKTVAAPKKSILSNRFLGTGISILAAYLFIISGTATTIWPIFGSANQLLAALALLAVSTWLAHMKKKNWFVVIPMIFMFVVTLTALVSMALNKFGSGHYILGTVSVLLLVVAIFLVIQGTRTLLFKRQPQNS